MRVYNSFLAYGPLLSITQVFSLTDVETRHHEGFGFVIL
jgi:hypothetical protein